MRVAVNALHLVPGETGGLEVYARQLLPELAASADLTVMASREGAPSLRSERWRVEELPVNARSRPRRVLAEQTLLPRAARGFDLLHNLFNTGAAWATVPQVTTVHDLIYKRHPEGAPRLMALGQSVLVPLAVRRSRRVIAVSEATKRDLVGMLGVDPARVDVVHNGPGRAPVADPVPAATLRRRFELGDRPLILTVAAKLPHKNIERLIEAVRQVEDAVLVIPSYATEHERELVERAPAGSVRFAGWLEDDELDGLYAAATCVVLPSLAEGFGLPVIEAMQRGVPVACSDRTSLPEVAGDAAIYFDPTDVDAIAAAIRRLMGDAALRERLVAAGRRQVERFSWQRAGEQTLAVYRSAISSTLVAS
jgi:glycosyltransferase involved in cell wall biosynthesis